MEDMKVVRYTCDVTPSDWLLINGKGDSGRIVIHTESNCICLSPVDAISLGKKLIEFGQHTIDQREIKGA